MKRIIAILIVAMSLKSSVLNAEIMGYTDERGVRVYVDGAERVPEKYRVQAKAKTNLPEIQKVKSHAQVSSAESSEFGSFFSRLKEGSWMPSFFSGKKEWKSSESTPPKKWKPGKKRRCGG